MTAVIDATDITSEEKVAVEGEAAEVWTFFALRKAREIGGRVAERKTVQKGKDIVGAIWSTVKAIVLKALAVFLGLSWLALITVAWVIWKLAAAVAWLAQGALKPVNSLKAHATKVWNTHKATTPVVQEA